MSPDEKENSSSSPPLRPVGLFRPDLAFRQDSRAEGYAIMSEKEAGLVAADMVSRWKPWSDVWAIRHGTGVPVLLAGIPGLFMTNRVRTIHKIGGSRSSGRLLMILPASIIPMLLCSGNQYFATNDILLGKTACPVCLEVRTTSLQLAAGVALPSVLTLITNLTYMQTLRVRGLPSDLISMEFLRWGGRVLNKCSALLFASAFLQAASVSFLLHKQRNQWADINRKLLNRMEQDAAKKKKKKQ